MRDAKYQASSTTLTSLAILKVDIDEGNREYLDYLSAFVVEALAKHRPELISLTAVSQLLTQEFGLRIPIKAVQLVLRKLAKKKGMLDYRDGAYFLSEAFPAPSMGERREGARQHIDRVISSLCEFSRSLGVSPEWTPEKATQAVLSFLRQFAVDCLKTFVFNTALPVIPATGKQDHYIVSRFLSSAYDSDRATFNSFIILVKGQMYANALTCPDLDSLSKKFSTLTIYLDTPIILNILGLHGDEYALASRELVDLVRELNGSVRVFSHTVEEVSGVIRFSLDHYDDFRVTNRLLREIRVSGKPRSELLLILGRLEDDLLRMHIRTEDTPDHSERYQIDEGAFRDALQDEIKYLGSQAVDQDVNSVRSIYVRRQGKVPSRLEDSVAVFVTSNSSFAKAAFAEGRRHNSSREISPVITDFGLSNIAWLKAPLKKPDLPERETLAMCYAALEPSSALLEKYVRTMDSMRVQGSLSEEDHAILRASSVAQLELMNLTMGDDDALSSTSISRILEKAKSSLVAELNERHGKEIENKKEEIGALSDHILSKDEEIRRVKGRADLLDGIIRRFCEILSKVVVYSFFSAVGVFLLLGSFYGAGLISLPVLARNPILFWVIKGLVALAVLASWLSLLFGGTVHDLALWIQVRIYRWIAHRVSGSTQPEELGRE